MSDKIVGCVGDLLVEVMRQNVGDPLNKPGIFLGPYPSGASGIFIDAISRLGIKSRFIGAVGDDDFGNLILIRLKEDGVDISNIKVLKAYTTGVAFVTYFDDGSRKFIYHLARAATGQIYPEDINHAYVSKFNFLHIVGSTMSINENCKESVRKAIEIVKYSNGKITFDPNLRIELLSSSNSIKLFQSIIRDSYIVFPTEEELLILTREIDLKSAADSLIKMGPEIVVVKQGKKGSTVFTNNLSIHVPAYEKNIDVIDPTGAGDCYCAGFIAGILKGMDLKDAAYYANIVGALSVTKKGPMEGAPKLEEINKILIKRTESK